MATIIRKAYYGYQILFEELPDVRTKSWPLVAKPYQGLFLLGLYLMFVFKWGPKLMKNKKPYNLDKILIVYNAAQMLMCTYLFWAAIWYAWGWKYRWVCQPVDFSDSLEAIYEAKVVYYYFITKWIDLLDTVFFILRKKFNQISFLHVYHHAGMVMLVWGSITYYPGGHGSLIGVINCFVHTVMYGYYLLTVAYPIYKKSLWWKKYITQLQILQFFLCVVHMSIIVFKPDCEYPRWTSAVFLPQNLFMLLLFTDFYIKTYVRKPKTEKAKIEKQANGKVRQNGEENAKLNGHTNATTNGVHNVSNGVEEKNSFLVNTVTKVDINHEKKGK